jgi:hypothetical protein
LYCFRRPTLSTHPISQISARPLPNVAHVPDDSGHQERSCCARRITEGRGVHSRNQKAELLTIDDTHGNALDFGHRLLS